MELNDETRAELIKAARAAMENAYSPYSRYRVGAAVLAADDTGDNAVFSGCNVENASYGATLCAERSAAAAAITSGCRKINAVAVVSDGDAPAYPCGICRQVLAEFAAPDTEIIIAAGGDGAHKTEIFKMKELLPRSFRL